jgi:hypothetical protein
MEGGVAKADADERDWWKLGTKERVPRRSSERDRDWD